MSKEEVPVVSMSNTKKELLQAYQTMRELQADRDQEILDAEEARQKMENELALATADVQAKQDPARRIQELRTALGKELLSLAERFEAEIETFQKVRNAVEQKRKELEALYGIQAKASDLAVLIAAQQEQKRQFEEEMAEKRAEFGAEMSEARSELQQEIEEGQAEFEEETSSQRSAWEKERADAEARVAREDEERERKRKREQEEYDYKLKREREQGRNALEDELGQLEREITQGREAFQAESAQKQAELTRREEAVTEREKTMAELEARVQAHPAELDKAVKTAVKENTDLLTLRHDNAQALSKATFDGERRVLESRIQSLEAQVKSQFTQLEELAAKQEKAYQKVQEIANRAVDAGRREVVTVPTPVPAERSDLGG